MPCPQAPQARPGVVVVDLHSVYNYEPGAPPCRCTNEKHSMGASIGSQGLEQPGARAEGAPVCRRHAVVGVPRTAAVKAAGGVPRSGIGAQRRALTAASTALSVYPRRPAGAQARRSDWGVYRSFRLRAGAPAPGGGGDQLHHPVLCRNWVVTADVIAYGFQIRERAVGPDNRQLPPGFPPPRGRSARFAQRRHVSAPPKRALTRATTAA